MAMVSLTAGEQPGVRILTLDDPGRRNAIGAVMRDELTAAVATVAADPQARALVVTGAGSAFCAGADLPEVFGDTERGVAALRRDLQRVYHSFLTVAQLPIPTIAAVQGPAVGAGLNLAMCCDLRIAGPAADFAATFTRLGLHPGGGCTYFLVRALGPQRATAILLDGGRLDAEQAVRHGLALEVVADPVAAALERAGRYAQLAPELVRNLKQAVQIADRDGLAGSLEFEAWAQAASADNPALRAVVAQYADRDRRP